jgi:hypothetical protein
MFIRKSRFIFFSAGDFVCLSLPFSPFLVFEVSSDHGLDRTNGKINACTGTECHLYILLSSLGIFLSYHTYHQQLNLVPVRAFELSIPPKLPHILYSHELINPGTVHTSPRSLSGHKCVWMEYRTPSKINPSSNSCPSDCLIGTSSPHLGSFLISPDFFKETFPP